MGTFRQILVPIANLSARTSPALDKAVQFATASGAQLELFHDLAMTIAVETLGAGEMSLRAIKASARRTARAALEYFAAPLRARGLVVSTATAWDYPRHEAIVRRAVAIGADLIVVPQHVRHRRGASLAYTDWELLRLTPVPLLLVKSPIIYRRPAVLAAIDPGHAHAKPSTLDQRILDCGSQVSKALRGALHVVHAYVPIPIPPSVTFDIKRRQALSADAERMPRKRFDEALSKQGIPSLRRHLVRGKPIDVIPAMARQTHCAIVVIGAVSRSAIKRWFIGSTAEDVMDGLSCDLLVVKPRKFAIAGSTARRGPQLVSTRRFI